MASKPYQKPEVEEYGRVKPQLLGSPPDPPGRMPYPGPPPHPGRNNPTPWWEQD